MSEPNWFQRRWDAGLAALERHPRKAVAVGFIGGWYEVAWELAQAGWSIVPSLASISAIGAVVTWPDLSLLSWVTGPLGTGLAILVFVRTRDSSSRRPFVIGAEPASGASRNVASKVDADAELNRMIGEIAEREALEAALEAERQSYKEAIGERDGALQALGTCKQQFALARLRWLAERSKERNWETKVTIRSAGYEDFQLVERIEALFKEHTSWPVTIDTSNVPLLRPDERFKVVFVANITGPFEYLSEIFEDGRLLPQVGLGVRKVANGGVAPADVVIEVLPSAKP